MSYPATDGPEEGTPFDKLRQHWQLQPKPLASSLPLLGTLKEQANSLARWYILPLVEQQTLFNAAATQSIDLLAASLDRHQADIHSVQADIHGAQAALDALGAAQRQVAADQSRAVAVVRDRSQAQMTDLVTVQERLATEIGHLTAAIQQLTAHQTDFAAHLQQQRQLLDQQYAAFLERTTILEQRVLGIEQHLCDLDEVVTLLSDELVATHTRDETD